LVSNSGSLQHDQSNVLGGTNTAWLQYAKGSAEANMGGGNASYGADHRVWRMVESVLWQKGPLTGQVMLRGGQMGTANSTVNFNSLGGRIAYAFTNNFKLQFEAGSGVNKPEGGASQRLTKFTIAPTISVGPNFWDRPEFRFYVSRYNWNDAYRAANSVQVKGNSRTTAGVQAEIWF
jgi:maltoporin